MDRVAVFVDAGYVFAQGSVLLSGQKQPRGDLRLHAVAALQALTAFAESTAALPLLRIYWYDGTSVGPTAQHTALAHLPSVKVRLGFVNRAGEQKGVDSLIVTDTISLARNRGWPMPFSCRGTMICESECNRRKSSEFVCTFLVLNRVAEINRSFSCRKRIRATSGRQAMWPRFSRTCHATLKRSTRLQSLRGSSRHREARDTPTTQSFARRRLSFRVSCCLSLSWGTRRPPRFRARSMRSLARARRVLSRDLEPREKKDLRIRFISFCERRVTGPG